MGGLARAGYAAVMKVDFGRTADDYARYRAGFDLSSYPRHEIELRGRTGRLAVFVVAEARTLPEAAGRA